MKRPLSSLGNFMVPLTGIGKLFFSAILISLSINALPQSYLVSVNAPANQYPITFTDATQRVLMLEFDRAVTSGGTSTGWSITVGGVPVPMLGVPTPTGNFLRIALSSEILYANRNSVRVSYNATGGLTLTGGLMPNFVNVQAVNNYIATSADFSNGLYGENPPVDICAAVEDVEVASNIVISARYRNSIHYVTPRAYIRWMHPTDNPKSQPFYIETGGVGSGTYSISAIYAAYPTNTLNCTWQISIFPYLLGGASPQNNIFVTDKTVIITIPNYKRDNGSPVPGTGSLGITPPIDDPATLFCVGDDIADFIFYDATTFDCQLAVEPELPNIGIRHVQFVYGTQTLAGIPNVYINVHGTMVQVTDNNGDPITGPWYVNPDGSPNGSGYNTPSGFFEGEVVTYLWDDFTKTLLTPLAQTYPIFHTGDFVNDMAGDIFDVTLRNWGPCNSYDGGNPFTYLDAVTEISRLRLIESPPLPTAPDVNICEGGSTVLNATRNGAPNPGQLYWYSDAALTNQVATGTTYNPGVTAPGSYAYYVREISGSTGNCPGPVEEVVLTIYEIPNQPTISRNNPNFCYDGVSSIILTANPHTPPAITSYQWYRNGNPVAGATSATITLSQINQSGSYRVRSYGAAPTFCASPLSSATNVTIHNPAVVNAGPPTASICSSSSYSTNGSFGGGASSATWSTSGDGTFANPANPVTTYTPGTNDISNGTVTLTLTTNKPSGPCPLVSDHLVLTIVHATEVFAGADAGICGSGNYHITDATVNYESSFSWSVVSGTGTLNNTGIINPVYTPGVGDAGNTVRLRLTATGNAPCSNPSDDILIFIDYPPVATTNASQTICQDAGGTNLQGNTGGLDLANGATGLWTVGNASVITDPTNPTSAVSNLPVGSTVFTWTVSSANGACAPAMATHTVIVEPTLLPGAISGDQSICAGDTPAAFTSVAPASGGAAPLTYQWFHRLNAGIWSAIGGATNPTYAAPNTLVEGTHAYYRRAYSSSGVCGPEQTNTVTIFVNPGPTNQIRNITGNNSACEDATIILDYAAVTDATEYVWNFDWVGGVVNATTAGTQVSIDLSSYTFSSPFEDIRVRAAGVNGCNVDPDLTTGDYPWSAPHVIRVYANPVADAGSGGNECDYIFTLGAIASVGTGTWTMTSGTGTAAFSNANSPTSTVTVSTYGTKIFAWTEVNGTCSDADAVTVNFYQQPVANAGTGGDECDLNFTLGAVASVGTGTWTMTSGTGTAAFSNANSPTSTVTVTTYGTKIFTWTEVNGACSDADAVTVNFYQQPVANAGTGGDECDLNFTLGAVASVGTGTWTMTSGTGTAAFSNANSPTSTVTVTTYGTKIFTWTEVNGACSDADAVTVNFYQHPNANAGAGGDECDLNFILGAVASVGTGTWTMTSGTGTAAFSNANSPTSTVTVTTYGTKIFTWTEVNGTCSDADAVTVNFYQQPNANAGTGGDECDLNFTLGAVASVGTGTWTMTSGTGTAAFSNANSPTSTVTVTTYGTKIFTWTEVNGTCSDADAVTVNFYQQPNANAGVGGDECDLNFTLGAVASVGTGTWTMTSGTGTAAFSNANSPTSTVTVTTYGTKIFTWTEVNGTCSDADAVTVNFYQQPNANAGVGGEECDLDFVLNATASVGTGTWTMTAGSGVASYSPSANSPGATVTVSQYGVKEFRWTEVNGTCSDYDVVSVTFYEEPTVTVTSVADVCRDSTLAVIPVTGNFGGGASSASWGVVTGNGGLQNITTAGNSVTAEYVPTYDDITAGGVTLRLTTNDPSGPCLQQHADLSITINEAVYVVIHEAPSVFIAQGTSATLTATISGAAGAVATGVWTVQGALPGGTFTPNNTSNNITFTPTVAQQAAGSVVLRLTSDNPGTACGPSLAEITIVIGLNPVADAGPDIEDCEPLDSLIYLSGYAKASAGDANWSVVTGAGTIISQTKTWSVPQSTPDHDENDSLLVEAVYRLALVDYGLPSTSRVFRFRLTTDDPDGAGPVSASSDEMTYTVRWSPKTPAIGGGGLSNMCIDAYGQFYSVPLRPGNSYLWEIEVLTGGGVAGTDYVIAAGGTGFNFIAIDWLTEGTYNLTVTETTYLSDMVTPCVGQTVVRPIGVYPEPVVTAFSDQTICLGETFNLSSTVTDGSGSYIYEWTPTVGLSNYNISNPVVTGTFSGTVNYFLKVTDLISGCESISNLVTITTNPLPNVYTLSGPTYYCFGSATGATLTLSGSETSVYYQLINGATNVGGPVLGTGSPISWINNFDGSYYVMAVRNDVPACSRTMNGVVDVTANPEITMVTNLVVNADCFGGNEGAISITPSGGTSPYTFLWSGPGAFSSTNEDITGLRAGDYTVTITDARGCIFVSPAITVSEPAALTLTSVLEIQPVTCFGGNDGEAEVTVDATTGTAPYSYQWYYDASLSSPVPGATTSTLSSVAAATYYILITDANLCTVTGSITITQPAQITGSGLVSNPVSCNGDMDGEITVTAGGGSGTLEYEMNGNGVWQGSNIFGGLGAGTYSLRVRDANATACIVNLPDVTVTEPAVLIISGVVTSSYNGAQISCPTANDGIITVSGAGGTLPYQYNIDGGAYQGGTAFGSLGAGTYTMGILDARGCVATVNVTITAPVPVTGTATAISDYNGFDVTCNGAANGIIEVDAVGGTGTLRYSINGGSYQLSDVFTGLVAGNYDISVRDANGCILDIPDVPVTEPAPVMASASVTSVYNGGRDVSCNGASDGEVTATAAGGTGVYTWQWYYNAALSSAVPGGTMAVLPNQPAGTYYVLVTDENGCSDSESVTINPTPLIELTPTANVLLLCNGNSDGAGTFTATGGTAPYTFNEISNSAGAAISAAVGNSISFTGGAAGTVVIEVVDVNGCSDQATITISEPALITVTAILSVSTEGSHNINCFGGAGGSIQLTANGGTAPFSFGWTTADGSGLNAADNGIQTGLTAGTYNVTITDANGCTFNDSWTLTQPPALTVSVSADDYIIGNCPGSDALLTGVAAGGVEPAGGYIYNWSPAGGLGDPSAAITTAKPVSTVTYTLTVTDANGCTASDNLQIEVRPSLTATAFADDNIIGTCPGSDATLGVTVSGGEELGGGGYTYSWLPDNGSLDDITSQTPVAKPMVTTIYTVTVTDANGCFTTANVTITVAPALAVTATVDDPLIGDCPTSTARLDATVTGGEGAYTYLWDNAGTLDDPALRNPVAKPLVTTTYTVTVTDANGCIETSQVVVDVAPPLAVIASADDEFIGTCPSSVANLDAAVSGGEAAYTYRWTPTAGLSDPFSATPVAKPVSTTTYLVTVTDANGCVATDNITITVQPPLTATATADDYIIGTCPTSRALLNVTAGGGEPGYTYNWSPAASLDDPASQTPVAKPNVTTTYSVTVTDNNGCEATANVTIVVQPDLVATASADDYIIGTCPTSVSNLSVTVFGGEQFSGGGYTYLWDNALTINDVSSRTPVAKPSVTTTYTVTVTDANGCTTTAQVTINVVDPLVVTATASDNMIGTCPASTTTLMASVTGGEGGYTYLWDNAGTLDNPNRTNPVAKPLATTTYTVTVTDANGCSAVGSVTVDVAPDLTATAITDDDILSTCPTSVANLGVIVAGGEPGYTYRWSPTTGLDDPYSQTPVAKPAATTTYTVQVTDANGCIATSQITITVQPPLTATVTADDYIIGTCPGSVSNLEVTASGGEELSGGGYTYSWSPAISLDDATSQTPQAKPGVTTTYTVTVTDANGCTTTADVIIEVRPELVVTATADDYIIGTCPGSVSNLNATVTGGESGYTYSWSPADGLDNPAIANPVAKPDVTTTYTVTVTDANGCIAIDDIEIVVQPDLTVTVSADDYLIGTCPSSVAILNATASGGEELAGGGYTYLWSPSTGLSSTSSPNPTAKPAATTTYTVTVTDRNGCIAISDVTIAVADPLTATASVDDNQIGTCATSTAILNVIASGGEELSGGGYSYMWNNATTLDDPTLQSPEAKPAVTTTYTVTVTDANGCTTIASITVQVAPELTATAVADDYIIGTCPGSVSNLNANVAGGEAGYSYSWSPAASLINPTSKTPQAKPLVTTTYTVTVTDNNGCITTADVEIVVAPDVVVIASADDYIISTCPASVANLDALASGGEELPGGGYTYSWSPVTGLNNPVSRTPQTKPAVTTTYTVTVTDRNGCTATSDVTITVQPDLIATATASDYLIGTCPSSTSILNVTANGGEELAGGGYTYSWSPIASLDDPASQAPVAKPAVTTTYMVTVTDANGCTTTANVTIEVAPVLSATAMAADMLIGECPGSSTTLDVTVTGGEELAGGGYTYLWSPAGSLDDPTLKAPVASPAVTTAYTVTVTDANGCQATAGITIAVADLLTVTATTDDALIGTCPTSVANLFATASGGEAPYSYSWDNGATLDSDVIQGPEAKPAVATTYTVTVTDANGCMATAQVTVNVADDLNVTAGADDLIIGTCPTSRSNLTATVTGGETDYTYRWSPSTGLSDPYSANPVAKPNVTTTYTIEITDANGCIATDMITITVADPLTATASVDDNIIGACPGSLATLNVVAAGGEELVGGGYTYLWSPAADLNDPASASPVAKPAVTTTYLVTVTDANGCTATTNITVQVASPLNLSVMANDYIIGTCPGSESQLTATAYGGEELAGGGYTWSWSPVDGLDDVTSRTPVAKPLVTTTYTVTVTDANGCQASQDIEIVVAPDLSAIATTDDPLISTCPTSRANIDVAVAGGEQLPGGGYSYSWTPAAGLSNPFSRNPVAKPAVTTTYSVTVTDANGCSTTADVLITVADPLAISHTAVVYNGGWNVSCQGEADGGIDITVTGGETPYSYLWSGPAGFTSTDEDITGLMAGIYMVTVTDANGCIITYNITLTAPAALVANAVVQSDFNGRDVSCNGAADGAINLTVVGGTAPYVFVWTGPAAYSSSDEDPAALAAGTYNVTVTDANGCTVTTSVTLVNPPLLEFSATNDQLLDCNGDNDGYGTFFAQGGTMPYTFTAITNTAAATFAASGLNSQGIFGASAGIVTVRVTDANGCFEEATISFTEPAPVTPGVIRDNNVICFGDDPAALVEITPATGGQGGYIYQWQMAFSTAGPWTNIPGANAVTYDPAAGLATTTYFRREVRSGICTPEYTNPVEIVVNPLPVAFLSGGGTICPGDNAIISVNISQGTGPYNLVIDGMGSLNGYTSGADIPVSPAVTTTYTLVSVEDANGCIVTNATYPAYLNGSATVIVRDDPVITRDPFDVTICEYRMTGFGVKTTGLDLLYQWEVFDGSVWSDITDGGTYFGAHSDTLMIFSATRSLNGFLYRVKASTCGVTVTSDEGVLNIETSPEIINHPKDTTICVGNDAWMKVDVVGDGLTYQWYVNTGSGFEPVVDGVHYSGANTDSLVIIDALPEFTSDLFRVVVSGTCGVPVYSSFSILTVSNPPVATLNPVDRAICENGNAYFVANGYGLDSLRWQVDTGSGWITLIEDVNHLGTGSPQLTILDAPVSLDGNIYRLALYNECDVTYTGGAVLTVHDNPIVDFTAVDPLFACGGVPLQLNGNPVGGSGNYINHRWTGQVGPLSNYFIVDPVFTTGIQGSYGLNYMVTDDNGCSASGSVTVEVERPTASFAPDVTSGCPDLTINFTDNSTGAVVYRWNFGDGTPVDNTVGSVSHTYVNNSTSLLYYNVKLEVESVNGCIDSMLMGVTVYPQASANFTLSADTVCSADQVILTSLPGAYQYHWDYGDGVAEYGSNVINHVYVNGTTAPVTYTVRLTTSSFYSCEAWIEKDIVVYPTPVPLFSANPPSQVYPASTVSFTNMTTNTATWEYLWKFDDGNSSTDINPVHTYAGPGNYNVYLIVSNGECTDSINRLIQVLPTPPVPMFDSIPGGCSPYTVTMNNTSLYGTSYMWEFGDGGVSYATNPSYTYYEYGTFRITLTVTGPGGTRQFSRLIQVYETPRAYFEVAPSKVFVDDERVRGFNLSQGADYYIWEWGDGDTSMVKDPYHKYMHEGIYDITLHAYSNNGCYDSYTLSPGVTVEPAGDIRFANVFRPNKEGPHGGDIGNLPPDQVDILFFPPVKDQVDNYKLQVFNRSGVLIFESNNINIGWDGYYKGKLCMQGVYVWYVEGNYANGKPFKKVGDITLLH